MIHVYRPVFKGESNSVGYEVVPHLHHDLQRPQDQHRGGARQKFKLEKSPKMSCMTHVLYLIFHKEFKYLVYIAQILMHSTTNMVYSTTMYFLVFTMDMETKPMK